jgi:hypothetical protein
MAEIFTYSLSMAQPSHAEPRFRFTAKVLLSSLGIVVHLRLPDRRHTWRSVRLGADLWRIIPSEVLRNPYVCRAGAASRPRPGPATRARGGEPMDRAPPSTSPVWSICRMSWTLFPTKKRHAFRNPKANTFRAAVAYPILGRLVVADAPRVPHAGPDSLDGLATQKRKDFFGVRSHP